MFKFFTIAILILGPVIFASDYSQASTESVLTEVEKKELIDLLSSMSQEEKKQFKEQNPDLFDAFEEFMRRDKRELFENDNR